MPWCFTLDIPSLRGAGAVAHTMPEVEIKSTITTLGSCDVMPCRFVTRSELEASHNCTAESYLARTHPRARPKRVVLNGMEMFAVPTASITINRFVTCAVHTVPIAARKYYAIRGRYDHVLDLD